MDCKGALVALLLVLAVASARSSTSLRGSDILWPSRHVRRTAPTTSEDDSGSSSSSSSSEEDTSDDSHVMDEIPRPTHQWPLTPALPDREKIDWGDAYIPKQPITADLLEFPIRPDDMEWEGPLDPGFIVRYPPRHDVPPPPKWTDQGPVQHFSRTPIQDNGWVGPIDPLMYRPDYPTDYPGILPHHPIMIDPGFERPVKDPGYEASTYPLYPHINNPGFAPPGSRYRQISDRQLTPENYPPRLIDPGFSPPNVRPGPWLPMSPYRLYVA